MKLVIDGVIYQKQQYGGISRIYNEILPRICNIDPTLQITIFTTNLVKQPIPLHPQIRHRSIPRLGNIFRPNVFTIFTDNQVRNVMIPLVLGRTEKKIWHSTYYTMPKKWKGALVVTVYDMVHEHFPKLFGIEGTRIFCEEKRQAVTNADIVLCISESTKKDLQEYYGVDSNKMKVILLSHSEIFKRIENDNINMNFTSNKPFLLYVGSRDPHKGFNTLIEGYQQWPYRKEVDLVVVGSNWSDDERNYMIKEGIFEQVRLFQDIDDETLYSLYNSAEAFIYPSLYEGFGVPLVEAMACGCIIVASRILSTREIADDIPIYFEPGQPDDLMNALDQAFCEGDKSDRSVKGIKLSEKYSWEKTSRETLAVYKSLVE